LACIENSIEWETLPFPIVQCFQNQYMQGGSDQEKNVNVKLKKRFQSMNEPEYWMIKKFDFKIKIYSIVTSIELIVKKIMKEEMVSNKNFVS
jgi:hypothetical protein